MEILETIKNIEPILLTLIQYYHLSYLVLPLRKEACGMNLQVLMVMLS